MAYGVGDIVEVTWVQEMFSQTILNIQHFRVTSSTSSGSDVGDNQSTADHLASLTGAGQLITVWRTNLVPEWTLRRVRVQKVSPIRSAYTTAAGWTVTILSFPTSLLSCRKGERQEHAEHRAQSILLVGRPHSSTRESSKPASKPGGITLNRCGLQHRRSPQSRPPSNRSSTTQGHQ